MQGGEYAGKAILRRIEGLPVAPFRYRDKGNMAIIGRNAAVVHAFGVSSSGFLAWVLWLALHLVYLAGLRYRTIVLISWICNYIFRSQQIPARQPRRRTFSSIRRNREHLPDGLRLRHTALLNLPLFDLSQRKLDKTRIQDTIK
jgi:hypothetical protein